MTISKGAFFAKQVNPVKWEVNSKRIYLGMIDRNGNFSGMPPDITIGANALTAIAHLCREVYKISNPNIVLTNQ